MRMGPGMRILKHSMTPLGAVVILPEGGLYKPIWE
jgi:hypothetical protein